MNRWVDGNVDKRARIMARYGHISEWDISKVTDMFELFRGADVNGIGGGKKEEPNGFYLFGKLSSTKTPHPTKRVVIPKAA